MNDRVLVAQMIAYIERNLVNPVTAEEVAAVSGYSLNRFRQKFFNVTGDTPSGYLRKRRLTEAAKEILAGGRIVEVALKYGYSSQDNFTTSFRSYFGTTPAEIAKIDNRYKRFIRSLREVYSIMELANLSQPPLNATLMGCLKGASDYFDNDLSAAMLYGLSGHAFFINIQRDLAPNGPYVWRKGRFYELLKAIGIERVGEYELTNQTGDAKHLTLEHAQAGDIERQASEAERARVERELKAHLEAGRLVTLDFLEHQLISGYDEQGFLVLQPWGGMTPVEVKALTFGSWQECFASEGWAHLTVLGRSPSRKPIPEAARDALVYAEEILLAPEAYEIKDFRIGLRAYDAWIDAVKRGFGGGHGNWWNAEVWAESRGFAADFFTELSEVVPSSEAQCARLTEIYRGLSGVLSRVGARGGDALDDERKIEALTRAREQEEQAAALIRELRDTALARSIAAAST